MKTRKLSYIVEQFYAKDDGTFPNSDLSVLLYRNILVLPKLFPALAVKRLFSSNNWSNSWKDGIFEYHHYHSNTHEVIGVYAGQAILQFGGPEGVKVPVEKGDVLIIPAGMAHKNIGAQNSLKCVGAYFNGKDYDMNYGKPGERPQTDKNISQVEIPDRDPVFGTVRGVQRLWR